MGSPGDGPLFRSMVGLPYDPATIAFLSHGAGLTVAVDHAHL